MSGELSALHRALLFYTLIGAPRITACDMGNELYNAAGPPIGRCMALANSDQAIRAANVLIARHAKFSDPDKTLRNIKVVVAGVV